MTPEQIALTCMFAVIAFGWGMTAGAWLMRSHMNANRGANAALARAEMAGWDPRRADA